MPVARYFVCVGGALLVLMFALNAYLSPPLGAGANVQATQAASEQDPYKPYLRIRSAQKPPERVVIDTTLPTIFPAATVVAEAPVAATKPAALDALAQVASAQVASSDAKKLEAKRVEPKTTKRKVAKRTVSQPMIASAQVPMAYAQAPRFDFDFFGRN